jgi:hypothetical protein
MRLRPPLRPDELDRLAALVVTELTRHSYLRRNLRRDAEMKPLLEHPRLKDQVD